tara:strand:+ start:26 stop:205 length:180 start_codon:yes stop_codon:yes gene_type:complete
MLTDPEKRKKMQDVIENAAKDHIEKVNIWLSDFFSKKPNEGEDKDETSSIYLDENPFDR